MSEREEKRPVGKTGKKAYRPTRFMLPTSHYDKKRADRAVSFIQSLKHTKGVWAGKPFLLFPWQEQIIRDIFGIQRDRRHRAMLPARLSGRFIYRRGRAASVECAGHQ